MNGLKDSIVDFGTSVNGTSAKDIMDLLVLTQYFDTLEEMGQTAKIVFLPNDNNHFRNSLLEASAAGSISANTNVSATISKTIGSSVVN